MSTFNWIGEEQELSPAALTVRAQTIPPTDRGQLLWDLFFPRRDVDSVDMQDVTTLDDRPVADRREWNARGRYIPALTPNLRNLSMVPIESYDKIEEYEMQKLAERSLGNAQVIRQVIGVSIPARVDRLALANYRRLEYDVFKAWALGTIIQRNPQNASQTFTASYGISTSRITTAGTAWNNGAVNAYDLLLDWLEDAQDAIGPVEGVMLRQATYNAIKDDAPDLIGGVKMTRAQLEQRIQDDIGGPFRFVVNENSLDIFDDGGVAVTRTKVWTAQKVAAIPAGGQVGVSAFAPVRRAMELSAQVPDASIDVRGVTVVHDAANAGRELTIEAQLNAMPVPDEQKVFVIDAGV